MAHFAVVRFGERIGELVATRLVLLEVVGTREAALADVAVVRFDGHVVVAMDFQVV